MKDALLLDTCAALWLAEGSPLAAPALQALAQARRAGTPIRVSPMTAWEIGVLVARNRLRLPMEPAAWFAALIALPGLSLAELTPALLAAAAALPGEPPRDPVDRMMAATARGLGCRLITRDSALLDYARAGHMQATAC